MPWGMRGVKIRGSTLAYHSPADNRVGLNAAGTGRHFLRPRLRGAFHALPGQFRLQPKAKPLCGRLGALLFPFIAICSSILSHRSIRVNSCQVKMYNQVTAAGSGGWGRWHGPQRQPGRNTTPESLGAQGVPACSLDFISGAVLENCAISIMAA